MKTSLASFAIALMLVLCAIYVCIILFTNIMHMIRDKRHEKYCRETRGHLMGEKGNHCGDPYMCPFCGYVCKAYSKKKQEWDVSKCKKCDCNYKQYCKNGGL
jgi:hypothetical protein